MNALTIRKRKAVLRHALKRAAAGLRTAAARLGTAALLLFAAAVILPGCGAQDTPAPAGETAAQDADAAGDEEKDVILIKLSTTRLENSLAHEGLVRFKQQAEQRTGGRVEVLIYPNGQLGDQYVTARAVAMGTVEMGFVSLEALEDLYPEIGVISYTQFFRSGGNGGLQMLDTPFGQEVLEEFGEKTGIRSLGCCIEGMQEIWTADPVSGMRGLSGMPLRVPQTMALAGFYPTLGISPVNMPMDDVYDGMKSGMIRGVVTDAETFLDYKLYEVCDTCLMTDQAVSVDAFIIGGEFLESLPEDVRNVIGQSAREVAAWLDEQYALRTDSVRKELMSRGVTFETPSDRRDAELVDAFEKSLLASLEGYITEEQLHSLIGE